MQNNATHSTGQSFQENVLLKNITKFSMSSISFHLKFDVSSKIKVRKKWSIPKFSTITNNYLNWVWCHCGVNGIKGGNLNFVIFLRTSISNHWGCWRFNLCTSLSKHKCFVAFNSWITCRTWYIKNKYGGYNVKTKNNVDIICFK